MNHYKSWSGLNKQLTDCLCDPLKDRITYFLTRYHEVHNSYGRAAIRLDGKELAVFTWNDMYEQEKDINKLWKETGVWDSSSEELKEKWDREGILSEWDFLKAATDFLQMPIKDALESENCLIRIFAVLDRRVGKRTLKDLQDSSVYKSYPEWVQQFYILRFESF